MARTTGHSADASNSRDRSTLGADSRVIPVSHDAETIPEPKNFSPAPGVDEEPVRGADSAELVFGAEPLTIQRLEELAVENNPSLSQAAAVVEKATGIRRQVGLCPNPVVGYSGDEMGDDGTAGQQGGFISQTIVTGNKLGLNRDVADQDVQALLWEAEAQRFRVMTDLRTLFYATLGAQRRMELARQLVKVAEDGVKAAADLLQAELGTKPDVLQAEIQLNEVRILLQNAEADYEASWRGLASLIGLPDLEQKPLDGTLDDEVSQRDWEATFAQLLEASPELQAARARINRAWAMIRRQQAQPIPNLLTQVTVAHNNASGDDLTSVQVGVPLPIFNRNEGNVAAAAAEYQRAVEDARRLELSLRFRLAEAFGNFRRAQKQVQRYRQDILPKSKENLDLTEEGYKQGEYNFLRALIARRSYFEANLAYLRSLVALRQADTVIGGLLLTGGLNDVTDISLGVGGISNRGQALSGQ